MFTLPAPPKARRTQAARILSLCLIVLALSTLTAAAPPSPGQPAPPLGVTTLLQAPPGASASWEALRGRAVVVEFWATWCGPCIVALPHLNALADQFQGEPVTFLAITDESESVVRKFLETRPIRGWIGLAPGGSVGRDYGVDGIPVTVLVDGQGIVRAVTDPQRVTEAALRALLRGEHLDITRQAITTLAEWKQAADAGAGEPLHEVLVRPSAGGDERSQQDGGHIFLVAFTVPRAITNAYGVDAPRIVSDRPLPEGRFDFLVTVTGPGERRRGALREAIESAFGLTTRLELREMPVLRLVGPARTDGALSRSNGTGQGLSDSPGRLDVSGFPSAYLARAFERLLGTPVVDETGLTGPYDLHLSWDAADPDGFQRSLRTATGLTLVPDRRAIEVLVVERTGEPPPQSAPPR